MARRIVAPLVLLLVVLGPPPGHTVQPGDLPLFHLSASDGTRVSSAELLGQEAWIVFYAVPGCLPCDRLLGSLARLRAAGMLPRTLLVIGASHDDAGAYVRQALPHEGGRLRWYADEEAEAWDALQLAGAPMLVGIREGRIVWALSGGSSDPERLKGLIRSWLRQEIRRH